MSDGLSREILGNIDALSRTVFYVLAAASMCCFCFGIWIRMRRWGLRRGRAGARDWGRIARRLHEHVMLQRNVRRGRSAAGLAHAVLFFGFLILFIGTVLVGVEHYAAGLLGRAPTDPVFHKGLYFALFELTLDLGGLLLLGGCVYFVWRRKRGLSSMEYRTSDWIVITSLLLLGITGYLVEGARILLEQTPMPGFSPVGLACARLLEAVGVDPETVPAVHKSIWWFHAVVALAFIAAIPYCRLMHIVAGMANIALRDYELGSLEPVSIEQVEASGSVGLGRPQDLGGEHLLALDACVSCGRCQDVCPAYAAGKPLSPRDLVQDLRRHVDSFEYKVMKREEPDGEPSLHGDVISADTLWACTTCGACVDICPLDVAPLDFITGMRRFLIAEGGLHGPPAASLQKLQRSGNPWGLPAAGRFDWAEGLSVPTVQENPGFEILYWVGCAASYDPRTRNVARAVVQLLKAAGVNFACLGPEERCTGDAARRMGDEFLFQELAAGNISTLSRHKVKRILTHCPHCLNSLTRDYSQFGGRYEVVHHSQLLGELVAEGRLRVDKTIARRITYHDPCYLARVNGIVEPPRQLVSAGLDPRGGALVEMPRRGRATACCGAGGGRMWFDDAPKDRIGMDRVAEALDTSPDTVAVSCPFCLTMMSDGIAARTSDVEVKDISELLVEALESS